MSDPSTAPNILFVLSDQHRWDWLGGLGHVPVRTPNIDRLAQRGVHFEQCRVNSTMCAPSRACLATGRRFHRMNVVNNRHDLDPTLPTFMKALRAVGYQVLSCGKTDLHKLTNQHGIDGWSTRMGQLGFTQSVDMIGKRGGLAKGYPVPREPYMAYLHAQGLAKIAVEDDEARHAQFKAGGGHAAHPCPFDREHQMDDFVGRTAVNLLRNLPRQSPWFMQVNMASPHPPFDACAELLARYDDVTFPPPFEPKPADEDPTDHQAVRRNYAAMIEGMDEWIGRIIDAVAHRGELDNTIIVYASDHGEEMANCGRWGKGYPTDGSVRVPLVAAGPGIASGTQSAALVELIDLAATFADYAGAPAIDGADAVSLRPVLEGKVDATAHRSHTISAFNAWRMVTDGQWKYVTWTNQQKPQLFNLTQDPHETRDIASDHPEQTQRLAAFLDDAWAQNERATVS